MQRLLVLLAGVAAALLPGCRTAGEGGDVDPAARAVLERAIVSMGGDAALARIHSIRLHNRGVYRMGPMESPYTAVMTVAWPDQLRWELKSPMFTGSAGLDHGVAWAAFMAPPARCAGPMKENIESWILHHDLMLVRPLLHRDDVTLRHGGTDPAAKTETVGVSFGGGDEYVLTFRTHAGRTLLAAMSAPTTLWDGRKGVMKIEMSRPRTFGPITLMSASRMTTEVAEGTVETLEEETLSVEWNPYLKSEEFRMPVAEMELGVPSEKDSPAFQALVTVHEGPYEGLSGTIRRLFQACLAAGLSTSGQVLAVYRTDPGTVEDPADLRTDVAVPVMLMGPPPAGLPAGMEIRAFPAAHVASLSVKGPYGSHEGESIAALFKWIADGGFTPAGPPRVLYLHNPENTVPEDQLAEVQIPVRKAE